jgi:hypothetical protein
VSNGKATMNEQSQFTVNRLETARRARDRQQLLACCAAAVAILLLVVVLLALMDYWLVLPFPARIAGFGVVVLLAAWGLASLFNRWQQASSLKQVALGLEARRPELGCVVSTATEYLTGERVPTQAYEPELVNALEQQAAHALVTEDRPLVDKRLPRALVFFGASALAFVLLAVLLPGALTAFERVLMPWKEATYTTVQVRPGNAEVPVGRDQEIIGVFSGRPPRTPRLFWRSEGAADWQTAGLINGGSNTWSYLFTKLDGNLRYRMAGGDAVSPDFKITTYVPPEIKDLRIQVVLPAYTRLKPVEESAPNLSVLRGSELTFRVTASEPLCWAQLRFDTLPALKLAAGESNLWTGHKCPVS